MVRRLLLSPDPAPASSGASDDTSSSQRSPAPTSAGKARKPQKTAREIELEIQHSKLEDENKALKGRLSELEKWAANVGKPAKAGKAGASAGAEPAPEPAANNWDWEKFANEL